MLTFIITIGCKSRVLLESAALDVRLIFFKFILVESGIITVMLLYVYDMSNLNDTNITIAVKDYKNIYIIHVCIYNTIIVGNHN